MDEELPDDFDVIIVGTGLTESIVSGALSRIGKKVLHLDHMKSYGSDWSSFNLKGFEERMQVSTEPSLDIPIDSNTHERINEAEEIFVPIKNIRQTVYNGSTTCHIKDLQVKHFDKGEPQVEKSMTEHSDGDVTTAHDGSGDDLQENGVTKEGNAWEKNSDNDSNMPAEKVTADSKGKSIADPCSAIAEDSTKEPAQSNETIGTADPSGGEVDEHEPGQNQEDNTEKENVVPTKQVDKSINKQSKEYFYSKWRHFNLDLTPKLMFSRGKLVELLIVSNVCRYLEFRNVTGTLTLMDESEPKLMPVPCSRTDIFNSKLVTMVEKRLLMRILTTCANHENHPEEYKDYEDRPFIDFLASKKLSKKLQHFIIHSIAMVSEDTNTIDGLKASEKFLKSLGRYGNSAFLWTSYGVGELPQAFCRLGAVFGGTFCLNRCARGIVISRTSNRCVGIIDSTGQRLKCSHLVLNEVYAPESCQKEFTNKVTRAIYVTDTPFAENGNACLISIPPIAGIPPTWLIEVSPSSCVCPPNMHVAHATMRTSDSGQSSPKSHFAKLEEILFEGVGYKEENEVTKEVEAEKSNTVDDKRKPRILWSAYFNVASNGFDLSELPDNVLIAKGPCYELGFDKTIVEARALFESICPDEEFLPRAPNPEEIVYFDQNDEGYNTESNGADNQTNDDTPGEYHELDNDMDGEIVDSPEINNDA